MLVTDARRRAERRQDRRGGAGSVPPRIKHLSIFIPRRALRWGLNRGSLQFSGRLGGRVPESHCVRLTKEPDMRRTRQSYLNSAAAIAVAAFVAMPLTVHAQGAGQAVAIDNDDIGGVVTGPNGPAAGVWEIAEARDPPTRLTRGVVTDDQGRAVLPHPRKGEIKRCVGGCH